MPVLVVGKTCEDDDERNKEIQKIIVLISKTLAQHVRYKPRYICLSSSANNYRTGDFASSHLRAASYEKKNFNK